MIWDQGSFVDTLNTPNQVEPDFDITLYFSWETMISWMTLFNTRGSVSWEFNMDHEPPLKGIFIMIVPSKSKIWNMLKVYNEITWILVQFRLNQGPNKISVLVYCRIGVLLF